MLRNTRPVDFEETNLVYLTIALVALTIILIALEVAARLAGA